MQEKKLHLGCGTKILDGWINYDYNPKDDRVKHWCAGDNSLDEEDNSVDLIMAHHLIEHIRHVDGEVIWFAFFEECWRVLKDNGRIDILSPHGDSLWAWADPGHTRAIYPETFIFFLAETYMDLLKEGNRLSNTPYFPKCNFSIAHLEIIDLNVKRIDKIKDKFTRINVILQKEPFPEGYLEACEHHKM